MSVKLYLEDPVIVKMGPYFDEVGWGPYQFPQETYLLDDGKIVIKYHMAEDLVSDYGLEKGYAVSEDNGKSWYTPSESELQTIKPKLGVKLPSGRIINHVVKRPLIIDEDLFTKLANAPEAVKFTNAINEVVYSIPRDIVPDPIEKTWEYTVTDPESGETERFHTVIECPKMQMRISDGKVIIPFPADIAKLAPNGDLWHCDWAYLIDKEQNDGKPLFECNCYCSHDEGKTYKLKKKFQLDRNKYRFDSDLVEGFNEADIAFMPNGNIIVFMRSGADVPSFISCSEDGGETWSEPEIFDECGVWPRLLTLKCGVTLASYGRPGLYLRATADPSGKEWDDHITLMPKELWREYPIGSCCYTSMVALDDKTALLAYSDFRVCGEDGVLHKCIMARKIEVD